MSKAQSSYKPLSEEATKAVLNNANQLLDRVRRNLKTGEAIKISNEEYCKLQSEIRNTDQFNLIGNWHKDQILNYVNSIKIDLDSKANVPEEEYIKLISKHYYDFQILVMWIQKFLMSHETFYFKAQLQTTCFKKSFEYFRDEYFLGLKDRLIEKVFKFVQKARQNVDVPKEELKRVVQIYDDQDFGNDIRIEEDRQSHKLRVISDSSSNKQSNNYVDLFEKPYLVEIDKHFQKQASLWTDKTTPEYVQEALIALNKEEQLCQDYYPRSMNQINQTINNIIIKDQTQYLLDHTTGIENMLKNGKDNEMKDLYKLLCRVKESLAQLGQKVRTYYQSCISQKCKDAKEKISAFKPDKTKNIRDFTKETAIEWVKGLIEFKNFVDNQISTLFSNDLELQKARDNAFQISLREFKESSQYLSQYCDDLMKQQLTDHESNDRQIEVNAIFDYMNTSRDEFLLHYQQALCRRLIGFTSKSMAAEKQIVTKFKNSVGALPTLNRLQNMLTDVETNEQYNKEKVQNDILKIYVLNSVAWPLKRNELEKIIFPSSFAGIIEQFTKQYNQTYKQRKIFWLFNEGSAEINFTSSNKKTFAGKYILRTTSYQMLILMKMNEKASISIQDLMDQTGINKDSFDNNLKQLIKLKILSCAEEEKYTESSTVQVNAQFDFPKKVVPCLPRAPTSGAGANNPNIQAIVEQERTYIIKAYLVRIMKGRKVMAHNDLIKECVELIKTCARTFEPSFPHIRKCTESLIEEEYIKRMENDYNKYEYIP
ncbi:hypothetical protein ABPG74_007874 [Tetrahymena malaccensis]